MIQIETNFPYHRITRPLGFGGMGAVYEAWDSRLERRVALKILHPHLTADTDSKSRLLLEARFAARIEHPGVVRVYSICEHGDVIAMEMEYIDGTPLNRLAGARQFSPVQVVELSRQVLESLVVCHAKGVVHGDLKPANIMVLPDGRVIITDFGIARAVAAGDFESLSQATHSRALWGTPQYTPPEAWDGELPTETWDLYAVGVLAYELLTGTSPFASKTPAQLVRDKLAGSIKPINEIRSDISSELCNLINALLSTAAGYRPPSAEAALVMLRECPEYRARATDTQPIQCTLKEDSRTRATAANQMTPKKFIKSLLESEIRHTARTLKPYWILIGFMALVAVLTLAIGWKSRNQRGSAANEVGLPIIPAGPIGEVLDLTVVGNGAYFSYDDGLRGRELWYALPDGKAEIVADINPGPDSSNPTRFFARDRSGVFFAASTPQHGQELWYSSVGQDYKPVMMVTDLLPGVMSSEPMPVATWGLSLLFYATTLFHGTELWLTTTRTEQTGILGDLLAGDAGSSASPPNIVADETGAYFIAQRPDGWWLWRYEHEQTSVHAISRAEEKTGEMALLNGALILAMGDGEHGKELWVYRPGMESAELLLDIEPGPGSSSPQQFRAWNDRLYFQARTESHGKELWSSDGTAAGTQIVADIATGPYDSEPYNFVPARSSLYFRATDIEHGNELWITDGTPTGTILTFDLRPGAESSKPYNLAAIGDMLCFTGDDGARGEELWALDPANPGRPPKLIADLWPGPRGSEPHDLAPTSRSSGIFVYKTHSGSNLMRIELIDGKFELEPYTGIERHEAQDQ